MSKSLRVFTVAVLVLVLTFVLWFVFYPQKSEQGNEQVEEVQEEASVETIEIVPETSPTENTNPFEDTYKNPFE